MALLTESDYIHPAVSRANLLHSILFLKFLATNRAFIHLPQNPNPTTPKLLPVQDTHRRTPCIPYTSRGAQPWLCRLPFRIPQARQDMQKHMRRTQYRFLRLSLVSFLSFSHSYQLTFAFGTGLLLAGLSSFMRNFISTIGAQTIPTRS